MKISLFVFDRKRNEAARPEKSAVNRVPPEIWQHIIRCSKEDAPSKSQKTATMLSFAVPSAAGALRTEVEVETAQKNAFRFVNGRRRKKWGFVRDVEHPPLGPKDVTLLELSGVIRLNHIAQREPIERRKLYVRGDAFATYTYVEKNALSSLQQLDNFSSLMGTFAQHLVRLDLSRTQVSLLYGSTSTRDGREDRHSSDFDRGRVRRDFLQLKSLKQLTLQGTEISPLFIGALPLDKLQLHTLDICSTWFSCFLAIGLNTKIHEIKADNYQIYGDRDVTEYGELLEMWTYPQATHILSVTRRRDSADPFCCRGHLLAKQWESLGKRTPMEKKLLW